mmetsp:Transcript_40030/g.29529  ORF Transcript_40030/g.29529 Transcript_40030/m.29529 type:complete len:149 (+) Transcript_40030:1278-1724(+)
MDRFKRIPNLHVNGNNHKPKVSIYTFLIKGPHNRILHPNLVASLLNDLFGIQTRAGCQCASVYGQVLLGIDYTHSLELKESLYQGNEVLRVGYTRINFQYLLTDEEVHYALDAIEFIAYYGWMFMPQYTFNKDTGVWYHRDEKEREIR